MLPHAPRHTIWLCQFRFWYLLQLIAVLDTTIGRDRTGRGAGPSRQAGAGGPGQPGRRGSGPGEPGGGAAGAGGRGRRGGGRAGEPGGGAARAGEAGRRGGGSGRGGGAAGRWVGPGRGGGRRFGDAGRRAGRVGEAGRRAEGSRGRRGAGPSRAGGPASPRRRRPPAPPPALPHQDAPEVLLGVVGHQRDHLVAAASTVSPRGTMTRRSRTTATMLASRGTPSSEIAVSHAGASSAKVTSTRPALPSAK